MKVTSKPFNKIDKEKMLQETYVMIEESKKMLSDYYIPNKVKGK